jgi:hypothetical protein
MTLDRRLQVLGGHLIGCTIPGRVIRCALTTPALGPVKAISVI